MGNWSHSLKNEANGSNALGRNRIHDEYSSGLNRSWRLQGGVPEVGCVFDCFGFRVQGAGFRVQGSGSRVQGSGFRVQGAGFKVEGLEFRV